MLWTRMPLMLERHELADDHHQRYYYAWMPAGAPPSGGWPLVLALHGGGSTPLDMARFSHLAEAAERHQFAVVFPSGSGPVPEYLTWNAGGCCGHAARREVDDVAFIDRLLDEALDRWPLDASRVYATGMSNGGMFCYRLAAGLPHRVAAIAPVAGCLVFEPPRLPRPIPVLHFHGTADEFVPYHGGSGPRSLRSVEFPSVASTLRTWTAACGLEAYAPQYVSIRLDQNLHNDRPQSASRAVYAGDESTDLVVEVRIDGGGHTWPGQAPPWCFLGPTVLSLPAGDRIWQFFRQFFCKQAGAN